VGNADGEGQDQDDSLVHKRIEVNEYLVKADLGIPGQALPHSGEDRVMILYI